MWRKYKICQNAHLKTQIYNAVLSTTGSKNNNTNLTDTDEHEGVTVLKI